MKKTLLILFLILATIPSFFSQEISNLDFNIQDNRYIVITYDLQYCKNEKVDIKVEFISKSNNKIIPKKLSGDVTNVTCGTSQKITWDVKAEMEELIGEYQVKLTAFPLNNNLKTNLFIIQAKTKNERYESAANDFRTLIAKEPNKGENYFYFGENYFKNDDLDSALIMYTKGTELSPLYPLNYIGVGKVNLFKGKVIQANNFFSKGITFANNNNNNHEKIIIKLVIAEAFIKTPVNKDLTKALSLITEAVMIDDKNPEVYILWGDALLEQNPTDFGPAIKQYDKAFELDKKSVKAITRKGKLYERGRNYNEALKFYKDAEAIDATFAPAYREKAEIYIKATRYKEAIENYKKYLELNNSPSARVRFAYALFLAKQYQDAVSEIEQIIAKDPNSSPYLNRVLGYSYYEITDKNDKDAYKKGAAAMVTFFEKTKDKNFKYLPDDYKYNGLLMAKSGQDSLGVLEIEKAIALDSVTNCELWGDVGKIWVKAKRYTKAIAAYNKKANCSKSLTGQDQYDLGRAYFFGPKDLVMADKCFAILTESNPNYAVGYFWRAKVNIQIDNKNEKWLAKPHFEKALELVKPEEIEGKYKNDAIEACEYLGYYHLKQKDNAKAKEYFQIVNTLDPNNKKAKDFLASPEGK